MFHTLAILLHRPFVSDGHLQNTVGDSATAAFLLCSKAANAIDHILRLYRRHFCFKSCPYFLSYATYAAGTIHVRIAAQSSPGSRAHLALQNCLDILQEQQERCHAPRQSLKILLGLVEKLGVDPGRTYTAKKSRSENCGVSEIPTGAAQPTFIAQDDELLAPELPSANDFDFTDLDIETVMQSFEPSHLLDDSQNPSISSQLWENGGYPRSLYESLGVGHGELFDPLIGIDALYPQSGWMIPDTEQRTDV